ncbi:MAG: hypothetical protein GY861_12475 [bacterium]|nr:hypothetical protein [bacterium]
MAEAGILARSEVRLMIKNSYIDNADNAGVEIDTVKMTPIAAFAGITAKKGIARMGPNRGFEPRGISVNAAVDATGDEVDQDATHGYIEGRAKGDSTWSTMVQRFQCGVIHPISLRFITVGPNTKARGIIIHG